MSRLRTILPCLLLALFAAPFANGEKQILYQWNEDEQQHYSDHPPPVGTSYEKIVRQKASPPAQKPEAATDDAAQASNGKPPPADTSEQSIHKENCNNARTELRQLESSARVREVDAQGGSRILSEEEKNSRIERARQMIRDHCVAE